MKNPFSKGDTKVHTYQVTSQDFATFQSGTVHKVCSTFVLGREMEWSSRLFVLEMIEADEEGVGTELQIKHCGPAFEGETLIVTATVERLTGNELLCKVRVTVDDRLIATGITGQKILSREKLNQIFTRLGKVDGKG